MTMKENGEKERKRKKIKVLNLYFKIFRKRY